MDHRISKDMISNGMTPSGQKSQQDLSRSQYGSAATPSSLAEAYKKISEMKGPALPGEPGRPGTPKAPGGRPHLPGEKQTPKPKGTPGLRLAGADLFDIVKGHLIDEHNLSEDVALQLMSILDEETRADIVEYTASMGAGSRGTTVKMTADGKEPIGDRLLKGIGNKIGGFLNRLNPNALKSNTVEPRKPLVSTPKN